MNEEQSVLNFFAQAENLPLALSVADLVDGIRHRLNNEFWQRLSERTANRAPGWRVKITEDRNAEDTRIGISLRHPQGGEISLCPMMEQQVLGGTPRIYCGLAWSRTPPAEALSRPEVMHLQQALQQAGYKSNANFLAWRWTSYHPRGSQFLMRYSTRADELLEEAAALLLLPVERHAGLLDAANAALREAPRTAPISLDALHSHRERQHP